MTLKPRSVLDVGCGFGLWGFLCREYLDAWNSRVRPEEWTTRIDGIEIFEPYISAHQRAIYSSITIADIRDAAPTVDRYDLIITGDIIEHLPKDVALRTLETLYQKANKALLVNIPLGEDGWDQGEVYGNPAEKHLSRWHPEDFLPFSPIMSTFEIPNGAYGVFCCMKNPDAEEQVQCKLRIAEYYEELGDLHRATTITNDALAINPSDRDAISLNANLMIGKGEIRNAIQCLEDATQIDPDFHYAYMAAAKLLTAINERDRAHQHLRALLIRENVSPEIQAEAHALLNQ